MTFSRANSSKQNHDIAGSEYHADDYDLADCIIGLGRKVPGQLGSNASIGMVLLGVATIIGLSNMSLDSLGRRLVIENAASPENNGVFTIIKVNSDTSIEISNSDAISLDTNNGNIHWVERHQYSLEDDLNYVRTDRKLLKGTTHFYDPIPTYQVPSAIGTDITANLSNIAGKTTDALAYNMNRAYYGVSVIAGDTQITISSPGNLKHSDPIDTTGIPCIDSLPFLGDYDSCHTTIVDGYNPDQELFVLSGPNTSNKIYGLTTKGSSNSPDSIEIHFYSAPYSSNSVSTLIPYIWESTQAKTINLIYAYKERLDRLDPNAFRVLPALGILTDAAVESEIDNIISQLGTSHPETNLSTRLTNTSANYPFHDLSATPTVVESVNVLNQSIGNRTYSGGVLANNQTITQSLTTLESELVARASLTVTEHPKLRQLIHLSDSSGPFEGFVSGCYRESTPNLLPTSIIWYTDNTKVNKILQKSITYNRFLSPTVIRWDVYSTSNVLLCTATDTITYSGAFEISRLRSINDYAIVTGVLDANAHKSLRELIHLSDSGGPWEQFTTGAFREMSPVGPFPTSIIWYESSSRAKKIVEKSITYNSNKSNSTVTWKVYDTDGITVLTTATDNITYNSIFETSRTRNLS